MHNTIAILDIKKYFINLQNSIILELENFTESKFLRDKWERLKGGGGITSIFENGKIIEKAGVNFSHIFGDNLPNSALANRVEFKNLPFNALGTSIVIHPFNPFVPIIHMNVRFFSLGKNSEKWWFGGGIDLTPSYIYAEDAHYFHKTCKDTLNKFSDTYYPKFKKECDDYFYLKHRNEPRGVGGIFFDNFHEKNFEYSFDFIKAVGEIFLPAYVPILKKRKDIKYTETNKLFQLHRRSRYVEFNLIYDRGTLFGIESNGRTESILMSMPPMARWIYNWSPEKNSEEEKTLNLLRNQSWV
jgi:coproporphyrinogen III oxidase